MKARILRENFLKGIQTVSPIVPTRSTLPILSHLLIETKKDAIQITGTDLEIGITTTIPAEILEEGSIAIPAKRLSDLLKELPNEMLQLGSKKNQQASIECGKGVFKIMGLSKEEFPHLPHSVSHEAISIQQNLLQKMLSLVVFSVSKDESRYVLTGILFVSKKNTLRLVATDGRRMAMIDREVKSAPAGEQNRIVPEKTINELIRLLGGEEAVKISFKESQIVFDLGNTILISRLIDGKFPNYEQVIPAESPHRLRASREEFLLAVRRIGLWSTQESPSIRFDLAADKLTVSKQTPEVGEAHEQITVEYSGPEFSIGFNPNYLIDVLKVLPEEQIEIELPGPDRPGVMRTKEHYVYIVLPMQLSN